VEFFTDLFTFLLAGGGQEIVGHIHEHAQVAGGVLAMAAEAALVVEDAQPVTTP